MKRKTKFSKQILGVLLCVVMMLTYVPMTALAAEGGNEAIVSVTKGGTTENYTSFESAKQVLATTVADDNAVLTLLDDVDLGESGIIFESGVFTLELNGYTLSSAGYTLDARGTTNICIKDSSEAKTGTILTTESSCMALAVISFVEDVYPTITLESGTIKGEDDSICIWGGHFILKGGTVLTGEDGIAIYTSGTYGKTKLTVTGGDLLADDSELLYYGGEVDLTKYAKIDGIQLHCDCDAEVDNIKLPEGYAVIDDVGNPANQLEAGGRYTIGEKPTITYHPIWIGDEQVAENKTSGDGWSYDLEQNILTLNDFSYTGKGHTFSYDENAGVIFAEVDALTIILNGENHLVHQLAGNTEIEESYGICVYGDLTIKGDGSLSVQSTDIEELSCGISAGGITIEGCTVIAKSAEAEESFAVEGYDTITIRDAIVNAESGEAEEKSIGIGTWKVMWNGSSIEKVLKDINFINSTITVMSGEVSDADGETYAVYGTLSASGHEWKTTEDGEYRTEALAYNGETYFSVKPISVYDIKLIQQTGGTISSDKVFAPEGEIVTITVTPDAGKKVDKVVVKDENGKEIEVTKKDDGSYTYTQPAGNVTVEAVFKDGKLPASPKTGADSNLWLWFALLFVSGAGVFGIILDEQKRKAIKR